MKTILSLCDYTGEWSRPYLEAGYNVICVDVKRGGPWGGDVLELAQHTNELPSIHGILAAPPCTAFANIGRRHWPAQDASGRTAEFLAIAVACWRIIHAVRPAWWALENPATGRFQALLPEFGKPRIKFHPNQFGDPYKKLTGVWGEFKAPRPLPIAVRAPKYPPGGWVVWGNDNHKGKGDRSALRSVTPRGFARAFFEANP